MTITKNLNGSTLTIALEGRLDTKTSPELEKEIRSSLDGVDELIFDLSDLVYVSSAGLRVLLFAHKSMHGKGKMKIINANEIVMEVFGLTGFTNIFTIE
ncbi:MAG: STAS domain-containing protein [Anaerolineaceae bacterium]|nr:STAS domain-containing protein [Anaerolineaceae bacterium]